MLIGDRLRELREAKSLSQGDIEKRTGMLRCYISRFENGHTIPAIETLEKWARALEIAPYQLFYDGDNIPDVLNSFIRNISTETLWGTSGRQAHTLLKFQRLMGRMKERDREFLMSLAHTMAARRRY
jgi:transcriptional regulator with XRE-family HTH domain